MDSLDLNHGFESQIWIKFKSSVFRIQICDSYSNMYFVSKFVFKFVIGIHICDLYPKICVCIQRDGGDVFVYGSIFEIV